MTENIFASKKFVFALVLSIMGFVLVILDKTTTDFFFKFVEVVGVTYVIGNINDKINDTRKEIADLK